MKISIYVNPCTQAIDLTDAKDMAGNTDWVFVELQKSVAEELLYGKVQDEHGASLYKWENNFVIERTEEERRKEWNIPYEIEPSIDERMTNAEGNISDLNVALDAILEGRMPE